MLEEGASWEKYGYKLFVDLIYGFECEILFSLEARSPRDNQVLKLWKIRSVQ